MTVAGRKAIERGTAALSLMEAVRLPAPWKRRGMCLYRCLQDAPPSPCVAAFDFDKTLHFGGAAWRLSSAHIPQRLRRLHEVDGYRLVVFSNQHAAGRQQNLQDMQEQVQRTLERFESFLAFCGVPMQVFVAVARGDVDDPYRKPNTGMWELFCETSCCHSGVAPDPRRSFYVGNAAGRRLDRSNVDVEFAKRVGLEFRTEDWLLPQGAA